MNAQRGEMHRILQDWTNSIFNSFRQRLVSQLLDHLWTSNKVYLEASTIVSTNMKKYYGFILRKFLKIWFSDCIVFYVTVCRYWWNGYLLLIWDIDEVAIYCWYGYWWSSNTTDMGIDEVYFSLHFKHPRSRPIQKYIYTTNHSSLTVNDLSSLQREAYRPTYQWSHQYPY